MWWDYDDEFDKDSLAYKAGNINSHAIFDPMNDRREMIRIAMLQEHGINPFQNIPCLIRQLRQSGTIPCIPLPDGTAHFIFIYYLFYI